MSLSSPFIRRPVATALLMVAIVLLGGVAYSLLPVAALPNVSFPTIAVTAQLPGADPQTMASSVATPLEKQFGQIPYLTQMTSTSSTGYTQITLQFALNDDIIRVGDVGQAIVGPQDETLRGWVNQHRGIVLAIQRLPGANVISTVQAIKAALPQLELSIPPIIKVTVISDRTTTIRASITDVQFTLLLTIGLVVGVIFVFLRSLWATVIPAIAVPVSITGTFGVMYALGYSLDNLSLMGLSIAVGFVVDDAIVMVENIARHIEMGKKPLQAALDGAGEIGFTILSISISLVAVFIPLLLMGGMVGRMFQEFAVTVTVAIGVSVLVSLTLTPMMGARLLRHAGPEEQGPLARALERFFDMLLAGYTRALVVVLRHRFVTLTVMLATVAVTVWLFLMIPKGFFPEQDTGLILGVTEASQDISPAGMAAIQQQVISVVLKDPAVASVGAYIGAGGATSTENQGRIFIALKPKKQRAPIMTVIGRLDKVASSVMGVRLFMQPVQDINIGGRLTATQYQYTLADIDASELNKWASIIQNALSKLPQITDLASDQQAAAPQLTLEINRDSASRLGIDAAQIDSVLYDAFGQRPISQLYTSLNQYFVIMEVKPGFQLGPNALRRIYVRSQTAGMVPLSELVTQHTTLAPLSVNHQGQFPSVTLSFNLKANAPLGPAVAAINQAMQSLHVPPTIQGSFQGNAQAFQASLSSTPILIVAALIAVYIILGMLYENTIHPLTIISTLPSAGAGALLVLLLFGFGLDVMGIIGIILLIGIVKKNGIMLVDFALEAERHQGLTPEQSIYEACRLRFRPILMTTMCALLGGVPLMLGNGTGSELRQPLGYAMVGGLVVSQLLTLFTTPVVYIYMDSLSRWVGRMRTRSPSLAAVPAE